MYLQNHLQQTLEQLEQQTSSLLIAAGELQAVSKLCNSTNMTQTSATIAHAFTQCKELHSYIKRVAEEFKNTSSEGYIAT